jgi:hypothetical protein
MRPPFVVNFTAPGLPACHERQFGVARASRGALRTERFARTNRVCAKSDKFTRSIGTAVQPVPSPTEDRAFFSSSVFTIQVLAQAATPWPTRTDEKTVMATDGSPLACCYREVHYVEAPQSADSEIPSNGGISDASGRVAWQVVSLFASVLRVRFK